ncbi:MAG TPA: Dabb family protein [Chitinophagaceae bacterium]|nr:Dabb family protein [Chitinophagaceae bacterium]
MKKQNRKHFISTLALIFGGMALNATPFQRKNNKQIHHVFFWLKNPSSKTDLKKLLEGLRTLEKIKAVKGIHIGVPANTEKRSVVESSYAASELLFFDDLAGQKIYQDHPIHQDFIKNYSHLWDKVVVYDVMSV